MTDTKYHTEIEEEIEKALALNDGDYIEALEDRLYSALEQIKDLELAVESFADLLEFISENFGETADFPVRIDSDFYRDVFVEKISNSLNLAAKINLAKNDPYGIDLEF
jgi:hypothetical protein